MAAYPTELNPFVSNQRNRVVDTTGLTVVKGGITANMGFLSSVLAAYTNLVNNIPVLITAIFLIFVWIAEENKTDGPLENIQSLLTDIKVEYSWERQLVNLLEFLVKFLIKFKIQFIQVGFAWLPYFAKPSSNSMYLSILHSLTIFVMRKWSSVVFFLIANFHFLFLSLRSPTYKMVILIIAIFLLFVEINIAGKPLLDKENATATNNNVAAKPRPTRNIPEESPLANKKLPSTSKP